MVLITREYNLDSLLLCVIGIIEGTDASHESNYLIDNTKMETPIISHRVI